MSKITLALIFSFFSLATALASNPRPVHEFHASIAEVRFNPVSKSFEVGVRFFTDDLAAVLSKQSGQKVQINKNGQNEELIAQYTMRRFELLGRNQNPLLSNYIGFENQGELTWVYLEIQQGNHQLSTLSLRNTVLFDHFDDQVNTTNVYIKDQVFTLVQRLGEEALKPIGFVEKN